jgi:hypothetical protein
MAIFAMLEGFEGFKGFEGFGRLWATRATRLASARGGHTLYSSGLLNFNFFLG